METTNNQKRANDAIDTKKKKKKKHKQTRSGGTKNKSKNDKTLTKFLVGLSYQIPSSGHTLQRLCDDDASAKLLLESAVGALPMGSAVRKAVGERFDECVIALRKHIGDRLDELRETAGKKQKMKKMKSTTKTGSSKAETDEAVAVGSKRRRILAFSPRQYASCLARVASTAEGTAAASSSSAAAEDERVRKELSCTDYATAALADGNGDDDDDDSGGGLSSPRRILDDFRADVLSHQITTDSRELHASMFYKAVRSRLASSVVVGDNKKMKDNAPTVADESVSQIREFLACNAIVPGRLLLTGTSLNGKRKKVSRVGTKSGNRVVNIEDDFGTDLGKLLGLYASLAIVDPDGYVRSLGVVGPSQKSTESSDTSDDDDSDDDDDSNDNESTNRDAAERKMLNDMVSTVSIHLLSFPPSPDGNSLSRDNGELIVGFVLAVQSHLSRMKAPAAAKRLADGAAFVLLTSLEDANVAPRSVLPSHKLVPSGRDRLALVQRWATRQLKMLDPPDALGMYEEPERDDDEEEEERRDDEGKAFVEDKDAQPLFVLDTAPEGAAYEEDDEGNKQIESTEDEADEETHELDTAEKDDDANVDAKDIRNRKAERDPSRTEKAARPRDGPRLDPLPEHDEVHAPSASNLAGNSILANKSDVAPTTPPRRSKRSLSSDCSESDAEGGTPLRRSTRKRRTRADSLASDGFVPM